jgi:hypothetical protein
MLKYDSYFRVQDLPGILNIYESLYFVIYVRDNMVTTVSA